MKNFFLFIIFNFLFSFYCLSNVRCDQEKILICGVIKNGEKGFANVKNSAEAIGCCFADYRLIVYENNSTDSTKELYRNWAQENKKVIFISEDLTQEFLDNYTVKQGDYRTEFIARARNIVLNKAMSSEFDDFAYHIMVDLDGIGPWPIQEIKNTIEYPQCEWDAVCANGSYDLYALRNDEFRINYDLVGPLWHEALPRIGQELKRALNCKAWYKVESAFGGLAIYNRASIKTSLYKGLISPKFLEKIINTNYENDFIYRKYKRKVFKRFQEGVNELINWKLSGFSKSLIKRNCYCCEHVQFHHDMIQHGHDKIFINPNLKILSLEHPNY